MIKESIYSFTSGYRGEFEVNAYRFGKGKKSVCIVGAMRGNEIQQLYICSKLVKALGELEKQCRISFDHEITVVPCVNPFSMNVGKRFWSEDDRDINRDFPGNSAGEPTQRIAAELLDKISGYQYGIQFASFYIGGDFVPHVRIMGDLESIPESVDLAASVFGLPYVVLRKPLSFEKTTLNYNWQLRGTQAFSLYTNETERIDEKSASLAVSAVLRFMSEMGMGIIKHPCHRGYISTIFEEDGLVAVKSGTGGIFRKIKEPGDNVAQGELMAEILHPYENTVLEEIKAPCNGVVFFAHNTPLAAESLVIYRVIKGSLMN